MDTDLGDGASIDRGDLEHRFGSVSALEKEGDGDRVGQDLQIRKLVQIRKRQGWDGELVFALDMQCAATRDQHLQLRAKGEEFGQPGGCRHYLLEVIKEEQQVLVSQEGFEEVQQGLRFALFDLKCLGDGGKKQIGVADGSEQNEGDAVSELVEQVSGDLESEAGFADTTGAGEGHETHVWSTQQGTGCRHFLLAPDQGCELRGQVVLRSEFRLGWLPRGQFDDVVLHG